MTILTEQITNKLNIIIKKSLIKAYNSHTHGIVKQLQKQQTRDWIVLLF